MRYKVSEDFTVRKILDEIVLVPLGHLVDECGGFIALNESGKLCFELLAGGADSSELPDALCEEYDVDADTAREDAERFIAAFTKAGVLKEE